MVNKKLFLPAARCFGNAGDSATAAAMRGWDAIERSKRAPTEESQSLLFEVPARGLLAVT